ncbi:MAG: hypothetical protein ABW056_07705 [Thermoanaerobaculia bacterium]
MSAPDRRGLNIGVVLVGLGLFFLLRRELHLSGPGPILLVIGAILFTFAALRNFRGPVVPAGVLLGLGAGFLLRDPLEPWMPSWATILLGLGGGLLLAAGIDRKAGRERHPSTLAPGIVLVSIAAAAALATNFRVPENVIEAVWRMWPWALVAAGVVLVVQGMRRRA